MSDHDEILSATLRMYEWALAERTEEASALQRQVAGIDASPTLRAHKQARELLKAVYKRTLKRTPAAPAPAFEGFATRASKPAEAFRSDKPDVVVMCHPEWRGIRAATYGQCDYVLEVATADHASAKHLAVFLRECETKKFVINGWPSGSERVLLAIKKYAPTIDCYTVYHGTPAQYAFNEGRIIKKIIECTELGLAKKVGFVKDGLPEFFRMQGVQAEFVMNVQRGPMHPARPKPQGNENIGVFAPSIGHKNLVTQIMAALMVPHSRVHIIEWPETDYLDRERHRIVVHGLKPHAQFLDLLHVMDATLYVSLVECYPMTVLESLAAGAVCLTSHSSMLFDGNQELFDALVVTAADNPTAIVRKLTAALERRAELVAEAQAHISVLNEQARKRWVEFLA